MAAVFAALIRQLIGAWRRLGSYLMMRGLREAPLALRAKVSAALSYLFRRCQLILQSLRRLLAASLRICDQVARSIASAALRFVLAVIFACINVAKLLLWAARKLFQATRDAAFWIGSLFAYIVPAVSMLSFPIMFSPILFADTFFGSPGFLGLANVNGGINAVVSAICFPITWFFGAAQHAMPTICYNTSANHVIDPSCWTPELARYRSLRNFDTIFHAVFGFCVGVGVILEVGRIAQWRLNKLQLFQDRARVASSTLLKTDHANPNPEIALLKKKLKVGGWFAPLAALSLKMMMHYIRICFIVTAFLAGFMISTTAVSDDKVMPFEALPAYYVFAAAPFIQTAIFTLLVLIIILGCRLFLHDAAFLTTEVEDGVRQGQRKASEFRPATP